jgi:uncharacterized protein YjbI with pentapeptide repeats
MEIAPKITFFSTSLRSCVGLFLFLGAFPLEANRRKKITSIPAQNPLATHTHHPLPVPIFIIPLVLEQRRRLNFQRRNLSELGTQITAVDFSLSNFQESVANAEFQGCTLSCTNFIRAELSGTFYNSIAQHTSFAHARCSSLFAEDTDFSHSDFSYLKTSEGSEYIRCTFFKCRFQKANLSGSTFSCSTFDSADLTQTFFRESLFEQCSFRGADLSKAEFINVDCSEADFTEANLSFIKLKNTNFRESSLINTNLGGAIFLNSDLRGADLTGAYLEDTSFLGTLIDKETKGNISLMIQYGAHFIKD